MKAGGYIGKKVEVDVDRPLGSKHPKLDYIYPINYGYLRGTEAGDGEELDAYIIGPLEPLDKFVGICIAVIHRFDDNEDKLVVAPEGQSLSDDEIVKATSFQEQFFKTEIVRG